MRFLIDNNLAPRVADELRANGRDALHLRDLQMQSARDADVLRVAAEQNRTLISRDADFARILATEGLAAPSVILLKRLPRQRSIVVQIILRTLPSLDDALAEGSLVVIEPSRVRVRRLPIHG